MGIAFGIAGQFTSESRKAEAQEDLWQDLSGRFTSGYGHDFKFAAAEILFEMAGRMGEQTLRHTPAARKLDGTCWILPTAAFPQLRA